MVREYAKHSQVRSVWVSFDQNSKSPILEDIHIRINNRIVYFGIQNDQLIDDTGKTMEQWMEQRPTSFPIVLPNTLKPGDIDYQYSSNNGYEHGDHPFPIPVVIEREYKNNTTYASKRFAWNNIREYLISHEYLNKFFILEMDYILK
jgi:hypothetical protein